MPHPLLDLRDGRLVRDHRLRVVGGDLESAGKTCGESCRPRRLTGFDGRLLGNTGRFDGNSLLRRLTPQPGGV